MCTFRIKLKALHLSPNGQVTIMALRHFLIYPTKIISHFFLAPQKKPLRLIDRSWPNVSRISRIEAFLPLSLLNGGSPKKKEYFK